MGTLSEIKASDLSTIGQNSLRKWCVDGKLDTNEQKAIKYLDKEDQEALLKALSIKETELGNKDLQLKFIDDPGQIRSTENSYDPINIPRGPNTGHVGASASDSVPRTRPQTPPAEPEEEKGFFGKIWDGVKSFFSGIWGAIKSAGSWIAGLISSDDEKDPREAQMA